MTLVPLPGDTWWLPMPPGGLRTSSFMAPTNTVLLDADQEEVQMIGRVHIDGGGTKTFGGGSSALGWLPGTPITFAASSTVRLGVKTAIDFANGPPGRATFGAAAFTVYRDLVGGTDTMTAQVWRSDGMTTGSPLTVTQGDQLALCWLLTTTGGTPAVRVQGGALAATPLYPSISLVTAGPTYTAQPIAPNGLLTFADGTLGWLEASHVYSVGDATVSIPTLNNMRGNIFRLLFGGQVDAIMLPGPPSTATANYAVELYGTPLSTPTLLASVTQDANVLGAINTSPGFYPFPAPVTLAANTDYCAALRNTAGVGVNAAQYDVADAAHLKVSGLDATCYAADLTAPSTVFVQQNSGRRRYLISVRVSAIDIPDPVGGSLVGPGRLVRN